MNDFPYNLPPTATTTEHQYRHGGVIDRVFFENGYGASIVNHSFSYGTELAVLKGKGGSNENWTLCYDTPITDDVIGHLTPTEIEALLIAIAALENA